jgi:hypothetical protein
MVGSRHFVPVTSAPETICWGSAAAKEEVRIARRRVEMCIVMVIM